MHILYLTNFILGFFGKC